MPPYILAMKLGNPPHCWCHSDRATICRRMLSVIIELSCLCRYSIVSHVLEAFGSLIGFFAVLPEPLPSRKPFHSRHDLICSHPRILFQSYILTDQERVCNHVMGNMTAHTYSQYWILSTPPPRPIIALGARGISDNRACLRVTTQITNWIVLSPGVPSELSRL
jgi:hypothetical protein